MTSGTPTDENFTILLFRLSATHMLPLLSIAAPTGSLSCTPSAPNWLAYVGVVNSVPAGCVNLVVVPAEESTSKYSVMPFPASFSLDSIFRLLSPKGDSNSLLLLRVNVVTPPKDPASTTLPVGSTVRPSPPPRLTAH